MDQEKDFTEQYNAGHNQILHEWVVSDFDTPVSAYLKLTNNEDYSFLFESVEGGEKLGRYTIIGYDPDIIWTCDDYRHVKKNPLDELRALLKTSRIDLPSDADLPPMAASGLFGYMGYDMIRLVEKIPDTNPDTLNIPDSIFVRPQVLVVFDNIKHKICVIVPVYFQETITAEDALYQAKEKLELAITKIRGNLDAPTHISQYTALPAPQFQMTKAQYFEMVEKGKEYIRAGDIFQFVPSQRFVVDFDLPAFDLYRALRRTNPSPFLFFIRFPEFSLVGSSPEILVRVRDGEVTIRPIAGTRPRGKNHAHDIELKEDLLNDPKEIAEHLMLLDLGRNDVGKVSKIGSVNVTEQFIIEYYSHVMHIVSNVTGKLRDDLDALDALMSGSPAGTVSGAPKIRAMEIIDELEPIKRKFYGGGVGYLASNSNIDTCIALRTCVVKDGKIHLQAGGGVVVDSVPENEFQESINKSKAILRAAEEAILGSRKN